MTFGFLLALLEGFGERLAVVNVEGDAEPVEDFAGVVADRLGTKPPPAGMAVACANHAGFDVVVDAGGDGVGPGFENAMRGRQDRRHRASPGREFVDGEADVVEEVLVGVGDAAVRGSHPDGLGIEIGEDAVAGFAGG